MSTSGESDGRAGQAKASAVQVFCGRQEQIKGL
jgi:hypothetical protein